MSHPSLNSNSKLINKKIKTVKHGIQFSNFMENAMTTQDKTCSFTLVTVEEQDNPDSKILVAKVFEAGKNGLYNKVETNRPYMVQLEDIPVANIFELSKYLLELEPYAHQYIVRGAILPDVKPTELVRAIKRQYDRDTPTLKDTARRWALLDIDSVPCPEHIDPVTDPESAVAYILSLLPEPFKDCSCHWQFSGSQGIQLEHKPTPNLLKIHLWFWFDEAVSEAKIKAFLKPFRTADGNSLFDLQMYSGNQPYYTANPVFLDGAKDPLPVRSGLRFGKTNEVTLPEYEPPVPTKTKPREKKFTLKVTDSKLHDKRLNSALDHLPADDYYVWLMVGMALHGTDHDNTREMWDHWSLKSPKFEPNEQHKTWNTFSADTKEKVGIRRIFKLADESGWLDTRGHKLYPGTPPLNSEKWIPVSEAKSKLDEVLNEFFANPTRLV